MVFHWEKRRFLWCFMGTTSYSYGKESFHATRLQHRLGILGPLEAAIRAAVTEVRPALHSNRHLTVVNGDDQQPW